MAILKKAPEGARVLDLNASRVAHAEALAAEGAPNPVIKLAAGFIEVRPDLNLLCAEDFTEGRFSAGLAKILIDPTDADELLKGGLTKEDLEAISAFITGKSLGESPA